mmetsp:Transcript_44302/g.53223  ORF Transcript_44302/g.53223 Transcript_44302/m.53223 type:complete len:105 (-) Transcript_44302:1217-1531(-)
MAIKYQDKIDISKSLFQRHTENIIKYIHIHTFVCVLSNNIFFKISCFGENELKYNVGKHQSKNAIAFRLNSMPKKQAALAGNARINAGLMPLTNAEYPSSLTNP